MLDRSRHQSCDILSKTLQKVIDRSTSIEKFSKINPESYLRDPHMLMVDSWKRNQEVGSSTLVVVTFPKDESLIYTSMIGDSGYCILRKDPNNESKYILYFESKPQLRAFNCPKQLGWNLKGKTPGEAYNNFHEVQEGDIIIVASDGVLDNLDARGVRISVLT